MLNRAIPTSRASNQQSLLAHEVERGTLAKWCVQSDSRAPPTAVLVHGILGSRRNLKSFARMLLEEHPAWQVLLVDLRSHGETAASPAAAPGPNSVDSAAADVLRLLHHLKLFPTMLVGHSFGGKVVLSMVEQFGGNLPRPVMTWVLDAVPGELAPPPPRGQALRGTTGLDHPRELIRALMRMPTPLLSRTAVAEALREQGFSEAVARWVTTNLRPATRSGSGPSSGHLSWTFDLSGIRDMYDSYEAKSHWALLEAPPKGLNVQFVKAEHSSFRWQGDVVQEIRRLGHSVHELRDSGHWVHTDNPQGLLEIMQPAFCQRDDVRRIHRSFDSQDVS